MNTLCNLHSDNMVPDEYYTSTEKSTIQWANNQTVHERISSEITQEIKEKKEKQLTEERTKGHKRDSSVANNKSPEHLFAPCRDHVNNIKRIQMQL